MDNTEAEAVSDPPPALEEEKFRNGRELGKIVWITGAVHGLLGILSIPFLVSMEPAFQLNGDKMLGLPIFVLVVGFIATGLQLAGSGCATKMVRNTCLDLKEASFPPSHHNGQSFDCLLISLIAFQVKIARYLFKAAMFTTLFENFMVAIVVIYLWYVAGEVPTAGWLYPVSATYLTYIGVCTATAFLVHKFCQFLEVPEAAF